MKKEVQSTLLFIESINADDRIPKNQKIEMLLSELWNLVNLSKNEVIANMNIQCDEKNNHIIGGMKITK